MTIKILFTLFISIIGIKSLAQNVELKNLTFINQDSKTIYLGIENKFLITGLTNKIETEGDKLSYSVQGDTLLLKPFTTGHTLLTLQTNTGTQKILFCSELIRYRVIFLLTLVHEYFES